MNWKFAFLEASFPLLFKKSRRLSLVKKHHRKLSVSIKTYLFKHQEWHHKRGILHSWKLLISIMLRSAIKILLKICGSGHPWTGVVKNPKSSKCRPRRYSSMKRVSFNTIEKKTTKRFSFHVKFCKNSLRWPNTKIPFWEVDVAFLGEVY